MHGTEQGKSRVIVYVDGFNLYKGLLARIKPQYKWLDLVTFAELLFPDDEVVGVHYFTAVLKPLRDDPRVPQRQAAYLRALGTLDRLTVQYGSYIFTKQWLPRHPEQINSDGRVDTFRVKRPEEKGSDVNLATQLLVDAFRDRADTFAVVTNDSDLFAPMAVAATELGKQVVLVSTVGERYNKIFDRVPGLKVRIIRDGVLAASQFPTRLQDDAERWIHKPSTWP